MHRTGIAIIVSIVAIAIIMAATYKAFFAVAAHIPAGGMLGMIGAALMVGSTLACAGVAYGATKWVKRSADPGRSTDQSATGN